MQILIESDRIFINQQAYTQIISKFKMDECVPVTTPMEFDHEEVETSKSAKNIPYRMVMGSLLYLSNVTRPDIVYSINFFSRFMENPTVLDSS